MKTSVVVKGKEPRCPEKPLKRIWCGSCTHGILFGMNKSYENSLGETARCDECKIFPDDEAAALAVEKCFEVFGGANALTREDIAVLLDCLPIAAAAGEFSAKVLEPIGGKLDRMHRHLKVKR